MYKNYFILNRLAIELNELISESTLLESFTQDKDKLIFSFAKGENNYFIEFSTNPGFPFINLRKTFSKSKKNTTNFFSEHFPVTVNSISMSDDDRIIQISTIQVDFYFLIRGKYTNVCCIDHNKNISFFKKLDEEIQQQVNEELAGKNFIPSKNLLENMKIDEDISAETLRKQYPIISKEIITELSYRNLELNNANLHSLLTEIFSKHPAVFIDEDEGSIHLAVESFHIFPSTKIKLFDSLIEAFNYFISNRYSIESKASSEKIILKHLDKELLRLSRKIDNLKIVVERKSKEDEYNKIANLLLINLNKIKAGVKEITLVDIYNMDTPLNIKLDTKLSPQRNADLYFHKAKSERIGLEKSRLLLKQCELDFHKFQLLKKKTIESKSSEELKNIMKELGIKETQSKEQSADDLKIKFKHYIIQNKYHVFVGKDSENNDLLTTRFAKQNDYWFHARSVSGSHVVLRVENSKEAVPKNILKSVAALAAYHSKAKTSGLAPVSFTLKKYVVKKKGFPAGTVHLLKEDVLLVKPAIPADAEYVEKE
jgi:predicted ribosome quality control (RQC) complex YloA/Tae2 family protein